MAKWNLLLLHYQKIKKLLAGFLTQFIFVQNQEENRIFDIELQKTSKGTLNMGIVETVKEIVREETERKTELKVEQKNKTEFVTNLILDFGFSDEQASKAATVSLEFVRKIRTSITKKQKI